MATWRYLDRSSSAIARAGSVDGVPLDHHVEEVLVALSPLAELLSTHPSRGESYP
jgi:hypothetical protein